MTRMRINTVLSWGYEILTEQLSKWAKIGKLWIIIKVGNVYQSQNYLNFEALLSLLSLAFSKRWRAKFLPILHCCQNLLCQEIDSMRASRNTNCFASVPNLRLCGEETEQLVPTEQGAAIGCKQKLFHFTSGQFCRFDVACRNRGF